MPVDWPLHTDDQLVLLSFAAAVMVQLRVPPRWPSGKDVLVGSERSGVRIPLATGFFRVESYQ